MEWIAAPDYWLGRLLCQRLVAAVYLLGFLAAARQFRALIGAHGLLPVPRFLARVRPRQAPSLFHLHYSDRAFAALAWTGVLLAAAVLAGAAELLPLGGAMALWAVLWVLYLSIVNVGQTWYAFGWESLLLEAGSLMVFLGNGQVAPPWPVLWLLRWLVFRVEFGAGMIKIRGDACWRRLTCTRFHHETQPMPGPLSWFFHHLPALLHRIEVAANHFVQLLVPFLLFTPQPVAGWAALAMITTQLWLVASGNFAWLNWLTIALAAATLPGRAPAGSLPRPTPLWFGVLAWAVTALVAYLSYRPARNLLSRRQQMNRSYNPLHLVNAYGAFGSVNRMRLEVVIEGERAGHWQEYGFRGKPGELHRMPRQYAPYHLRLDWLMWFAGISPSYARPWFTGLAARLLVNDPDTLRLLRHNPFPHGPPERVRARLYRYRFTDWRELRTTGAWWRRALVREYLAPVTLHEVGHLLDDHPHRPRP
ncbi:lipase maturation factor family protein [Kitasatospora sp. MMS16-BH015]|uniref:lipase maturation factor family protein n=1 Tax=Kitasatospora sp. MMS16-BH015 TaxID=2018025 RepID=UPI000CF28963|nr:lipase maturation factor family protein [Kitasatospora sp. MMS16-BH015]